PARSRRHPRLRAADERGGAACAAALRPKLLPHCPEARDRSRAEARPAEDCHCRIGARATLFTIALVLIGETLFATRAVLAVEALVAELPLAAVLAVAAVLVRRFF